MATSNEARTVQCDACAGTGNYERCKTCRGTGEIDVCRTCDDGVPVGVLGFCQLCLDEQGETDRSWPVVDEDDERSARGLR
jgi:RecJ-like exonuclease